MPYKKKNYPKNFKSPGLAINHYQPDKPVRINATKQRVDEGWLAFGKIEKNFVKPSLSLSKKNVLKRQQKIFIKCLDF